MKKIVKRYKSWKIIYQHDKRNEKIHIKYINGYEFEVYLRKPAFVNNFQKVDIITFVNLLMDKAKFYNEVDVISKSIEVKERLYYYAARYLIQSTGI